MGLTRSLAAHLSSGWSADLYHRAMSSWNWTRALYGVFPMLLVTGATAS